MKLKIILTILTIVIILVAWSFYASKTNKLNLSKKPYWEFKKLAIFNLNKVPNLPNTNNTTSIFAEEVFKASDEILNFSKTKVLYINKNKTYYLKGDKATTRNDAKNDNISTLNLQGNIKFLDTTKNSLNTTTITTDNLIFNLDDKTALIPAALKMVRGKNIVNAARADFDLIKKHYNLYKTILTIKK